MSEITKISYEGIVESADLADKNLTMNKVYPYSEFWKLCVQDTQIGSNGISWLDTTARHQLKAGINEEWALRKLDKRMFIRKNIGIYVLNEKTGVAAVQLLDGIKKENSAIDNAVERCQLLASGLSDNGEDRRMLERAAATIDANKTMLIGSITRMRSIPKPVKSEAIRLLGGDTGEDDDSD